MITTGSKLLIGSALAAWAFAAIYGVAQEGALGTIGLISVALGLTLVAALNVFVSDSNVSALDHESFETAPAAQATALPSLWPLLTSLGLVAMTLGLATYTVIFVLGVIAAAAGAIEWLIQGWSERASSDERFNRHVRNVFADPLELPVAGAIAFGVIVYAFSRVMLGLPTKTATVIAFSVVGGLVLLLGTVIAMRGRASRTFVGGVLGASAIVLIAGGTVAGLVGERETHEHETPADLAEANECGPEETHADADASQTVAAKSSVFAELTFDGTELDTRVPGSGGKFDTLTFPRSNPTNVLFHNEASEPARLVVEMHPAVDDNGDPVGPERICTTLVEEGGTQFLTLVFTRPSFALAAEGVGYEFYVPGSDATVAVVVP
jgi:hypothetical protein